MDIEITERKHNPLLVRDEIRFLVTHEGEPTPPLGEIRRLLCAKLTAKPELTVVHSVYTDFGASVSKGFAKAYKDESRLKSIEAKHILRKNFGAPAEGEKEAEPKAEAGKAPKGPGEGRGVKGAKKA